MTKAQLVREALSNPVVKALMERLSPEERKRAEDFANQVGEIAESAVSRSATAIGNGEMPTRGVSDSKGG
jgi:hypothetical protein